MANTTTNKTTYNGTLPRAAFWDMDGTLINSEPIWHEAELWFAEQYGGDWSEEMGWKVTGTPVPKVAQMMIDRGTRLGVEELTDGIIDFVARREMEHMPWIPGVLDVVTALHEAGVPNVLVTASPRAMAESAIAQAPEGVFDAYVCADDVKEKKPDPAPFLAAAAKLGIEGDQIRECVALEDSAVGLESAVRAGATTIALTGYIRSDNPPSKNGPQFACVETWDGVTPQLLGDFVKQRLAA
ncbi:HAD-IA family hydrolase [Bifidobacterium sp. SMB2]|uniref:HAD-IA family hydrolase n=1 Tax=Bifidobacterium saimiriisciurei TaxID=2661627 RepID=A0ABX0CAL4_9BIFI|nr:MULTISPECIES: HAD family phosphatase [Bifidobacterium]NEG97061.1 HAD-IA family hydrolase [Bifidobacterium sp. SMB2]NEH12163.1 HAD-IA family hydrolase [Bifidobacterium saimiriisciurei]